MGTHNVFLTDHTSHVHAHVDDDGALDVIAQDPHSEAVDLYMLRADATPTLTAPVAVDAESLTVDTNANISDGDAIIIREGINVFQSLVVSSTATSIVMNTPSDRVFTVAASVLVGPWNLAVDGSSTPQVFEAYPPMGADFDLYGITISGLDDLSMDATTFIGIVDGISNGFLLRQKNGTYKNLGLFVNNLGFEEFDYNVTYAAANKHSEYGIIARKNFRSNNGVSVRLQGAQGDRIQAIVRDALQSQSLIAVIIHGHVVTN